MKVWYEIKGTITVDIDKEELEEMVQAGIDIKDLDQLDIWVRKNKDLDPDVFNTDVSDEEISDFYLDEVDEEVLKRLTPTESIENPLKSQLDLFGGVVI